jgi:hypothetical protein
MATWKDVQADPAGGPIEISVECVTPQLIYGRVWRYLENGSADGFVGKVSSLPAQSTCVMGNHGACRNRKFLVAGVVVAQDDNPPSPYHVVATVRQGGNILVGPEDVEGARGTVGSKNQGFLYRFIIR